MSEPDGARTPQTPTTAGQRDAEQDQQHLRVIAAERRRRAIKLGALATLVVLFAIFVVQNSQPAPVDFIFVQSSPRLIWIMLVCAVIGGVIGYILGRPGKTLRFHRKDDKQQKPAR
ncbi:MAG TPA: LapA family protein [Actinomycetota bacterium]|nr:LapA family protein [Actinomycetota bacterium]